MTSLFNLGDKVYAQFGKYIVTSTIACVFLKKTTVKYKLKGISLSYASHELFLSVDDLKSAMAILTPEEIEQKTRLTINEFLSDITSDQTVNSVIEPLNNSSLIHILDAMNKVSAQRSEALSQT